MATKIYTLAPAGARETRGAARRWWVLAVGSGRWRSPTRTASGW
jgi:hypothetical protein